MQNVATVIAPLNPLVVYFRQDDVEKAIRAICAERGAEWVSYQVEWKLAAPYCMRRKFTGLDGLVDLYRDYRCLTDTLFDALPVDKIRIENSKGDWSTYQRQILAALGLTGSPQRAVV